MKILEVTDVYIKFDNGRTITSDYQQECCENNYAAFDEIDDLARDTEFDEDLEFEESDYGFRFGNKPLKMFFVPCYSEQNGYYSPNVDIYYNNRRVLSEVEGDINY